MVDIAFTGFRVGDGNTGVEFAVDTLSAQGAAAAFAGICTSKTIPSIRNANPANRAHTARGDSAAQRCISLAIRTSRCCAIAAFETGRVTWVTRSPIGEETNVAVTCVWGESRRRGIQ